MQEIVKLQSTGQEVFPITYSGQGTQPWTNDHERVLIPNNTGRNHIQIVRKDNLSYVKGLLG